MDNTHTAKHNKQFFHELNIHYVNPCPSTWKRHSDVVLSFEGDSNTDPANPKSYSVPNHQCFRGIAHEIRSLTMAFGIVGLKLTYST